MAERPVGVSDLASGAGVARYRTRERTVGGESVVEQYLIPLADRVLSYQGLVSTFRTPGSAALQGVMSLFNKAGSGVLVAVRFAILQADRTVNTSTVRWIGASRITTAPTDGTLLTPIALDSADSHSSSVEARGLASADGTAGTLTVTPGVSGWRTSAVRHTDSTTAAQSLYPDGFLLPRAANNDPVVLLEGEGLLAYFIDVWPNTSHFVVQLMFEEFTI